MMRSKDQPASAKADDTYYAYQIENLLSELGYTQRLANSLAWKFFSLAGMFSNFTGR